MSAAGRPRVLVLARNYPNNVLPTLGLWTQRLVLAATQSADPTVIAPVPYAPPLLPVKSLAKFRRVTASRWETGQAGEYQILHPRLPLPPGHLFQRFDARLGWPFLLRLAERLHAERRFSLIHAHFIYPEGATAARLGRRWGIPVVTTEQAAWRPWLDREPQVRRQVIAALPGIRMVLPVSGWLQRNIEEVVGAAVECRVIPNVVDDGTFTVARGPGEWDPQQILFVGLIRQVKGLDLLVRAFGLLASKRPLLRLVVIGGAFYRGYRRDEAEVRRLVDELGLEPRITFVGEQGPNQVAATMRGSAALVVPSRRETFSAVTAEAIASGTPVVATRCGGPEDIITPSTGVLVPSEDPAALAAGIEQVLDRRDSYDPVAMHADIVARFGREAVARRIAEVYEEVLHKPAKARPRAR